MYWTQRWFKALSAAFVAIAVAPSGTASNVNAFYQTNLVSDIPGLAANTDPQLVNPWGISFGTSGQATGSPFWISDNGKGVTTLYNATGAKQGLVVTIPAPGGGVSAPTGQVFNGTGKFNSDIFIFSSEDGTITGWRGALGTTAETLLPASNGAIFKGIAIGSVGADSYLYATDFANNKVTVLGSAGAPALPGSFSDSSLPPGYSPFGIENIGDNLFVTYALKETGGNDDVAGPGHGYVDEYDLSGHLLKRIASAGQLNSPWGLALAPSGFGPFAGDLLVGNFGNGMINAYNLGTDTFAGTLQDANGTNIVNEGLWALKFRVPGSPGYDPTTLYLTAGLNGEADGLFAQIQAVPEPGTLALLAGGLLLAVTARRRLRLH